MRGEYYDTGYGRPSDKPRRSASMWIVDAVLTLLTVVVAMTMILTYLVPCVHPARVWFFPVLGLVAPAVYVASLVLALYWIIRWRLLRAGFMLLLVIAGLFEVSLFWRPEFRRSYDGGYNERGTFKLMTYNVRNFFGEDGNSSVCDVLQLIREQNPDIVCLQEFNARLAGGSEQFALLDGTYQRAGFGLTQRSDSLHAIPMVILSKFRIVRSGVVLNPSTAVWADVAIGGDTVRIFNNHLRSTAINASDDDYITNRRFLSDTAREVKIRSIMDRFRENSVLRAAQVDSIAQTVAASRGRRIVCGDFNDTPMSYVYRTMADGLNDAFSECGSGYSHTFRGFFNTLRIDYVLSSDGFETLSYEVPQVDYSDHLPVVVRLKKRITNN